MTQSYIAFLLVLALAACRDMAAPQIQPPRPPPAPPTSAYLSFSKAVLPANASVQVSSTFLNESGGEATVSASWATTDSTVASIMPSPGSALSASFVMLNTLKAGTAKLTVTGGGVGATATVTVLPALQFASVAGTGSHCALTPSGLAYCWGDNSAGALGLDTATDDCGVECTGVPRPVAGGLAFKVLAAGRFTCGATEAGDVYCWGPGIGHTPTKIATNVAFTTLAAGDSHMCGLASDGTAWCWGDNSYGELGDGSRQSSTTPVQVTGGQRFSRISAGGFHTCGLITGGVAYCWGAKYFDLLGNLLGHRDTAWSAVPTRVLGDVAFASLSAGFGHTCGLTAAGVAYCWGANEFGQLGFDSASDTSCATPGSCSDAPGPVSGGITLGYVDASGEHTCGLTQSGQAYCWGAMFVSATCAPARGDGTGGFPGGGGFCFHLPARVTTPEALPGTTSFATHGGQGSCWMGMDGAAYCWSGYRGVAPQRVPGQQS